MKEVACRAEGAHKNISYKIRVDFEMLIMFMDKT